MTQKTRTKKNSEEASIINTDHVCSQLADKKNACKLLIAFTALITSTIPISYLSIDEYTKNRQQWHPQNPNFHSELTEAKYNFSEVTLEQKILSFELLQNNIQLDEVEPYLACFNLENDDTAKFLIYNIKDELKNRRYSVHDVTTPLILRTQQKIYDNLTTIQRPDFLDAPNYLEDRVRITNTHQRNNEQVLVYASDIVKSEYHELESKIKTHLLIFDLETKAFVYNDYAHPK